MDQNILEEANKTINMMTIDVKGTRNFDENSQDNKNEHGIYEDHVLANMKMVPDIAIDIILLYIETPRALEF